MSRSTVHPRRAVSPRVPSRAPAVVVGATRGLALVVTLALAACGGGFSEEQAADADGEDRTLRFVVPTGNAIREQSADIILQNLEAVGFTVEQSNFDFPTVQSMAREGEFDLLLMGFTFNVDPDMSALYSSSGAFNYMGYDNPRVDELLAQGKAEPDPAAREEIYHELQAIWQEDMPIMTTYSDYATSVVSNELTEGGAAPFWPGTLADLPQWQLGGAS
ncbi:ABC transporter substrate-binding protein [Promicromonospora panici]|uniref:ABC transporter substrate-binding protein n=1 Tax=Promicromonospora panici TaxID=2219658 RepID=UPI0013EB6FD6|nr:ABC transporter substrate-binding protein [Promicromonospora panici]